MVSESGIRAGMTGFRAKMNLAGPMPLLSIFDLVKVMMGDHAMPNRHSASIPITHLDLAILPERERFAVWKESIAVIFDVALAESKSNQPFSSQISTFHLGNLLLAKTVSHSQFFRRDAKLIEQDGLDHFLVQVYRRGSNAGICGHRSLDTQPGDVQILDLRQPLHTRAEAFDNLSLAIPRALLARYVAMPERLHGQVLSGRSPLGRLLSEHLQSLWDAAPKAGLEEAQAMAEGVAGMAAAYFGQMPLDGESPAVQAAMGHCIRDYIDRHLAHPGLGQESLAAHFRISRAQLYRLFKPFGGVNRYLQQRRLAWSLSELGKPGNRQSKIIDIARAAGFSDESHFSRAFRQAYGISPREVRQGMLLEMASASTCEHPLDRRYEEWLRQLGRPPR